MSTSTRELFQRLACITCLQVITRRGSRFDFHIPEFGGREMLKTRLSRCSEKDEFEEHFRCVTCALFAAPSKINAPLSSVHVFQGSHFLSAKAGHLCFRVLRSRGRLLQQIRAKLSLFASILRTGICAHLLTCVVICGFLLLGARSASLC